MRTSDTHRWVHPQTIPRGFLRIYVLASLSRGPATGYGIMQDIEEKTDGAWRPGPGTVYPLLKSLVKEGHVRPSGRPSGTSRIAYTVTEKGERELAEMRRAMASFGRKERVIIRLFSELMPASLLVPILVNRAREGTEVIRSKISELEEPARTAALRELALVAENLLDWAKSNLAPTRASHVTKGKQSVRYA